MSRKNIKKAVMTLANVVCLSLMALTMCFCGQPKDEVPAKGFDEVEVKPLFNGGDANGFAQWVGSQVVYPQECATEGIAGRVVVSFTIGSDGKVKDAQVIKGVHEKLDAEALRVINMSPQWTPGMHEGKKVPVSFVFPIVFRL